MGVLIVDGHLARAEQHFSVCVSVLGKSWQVPFPGIAATEVLRGPRCCARCLPCANAQFFLWWGLLREGRQILDFMGFGLATLDLNV